MQKIRCRSLHRTYDIRIGTAILSRVPSWIAGQRGVVLADARLATAADLLGHSLRAAGWHCAVHLIEVSEALKSFAGIAALYEHLLAAGLDRDGVVFALGGGALGDAVGFVAATYLRGVRWVGLPTTLLSQVDSAIGGKTAINFGPGKNLIGALHAPSLVVCDIELLQSLPRRDLVSGLGEIFKYGLAFDARFFRAIEAGWPAILDGDPRMLQRAVARSARLKVELVMRDEYELHGQRELLNLGHTVGHALEAATSHAHLRHGEAVIYGLRAATQLSLRFGLLRTVTASRIDTLLRSLPLPPLPVSLRADDVTAQLKWDKKRRGGRARFVLLSAIGRALVAEAIDESEVAQVIAALISESRSAEPAAFNV